MFRGYFRRTIHFRFSVHMPDSPPHTITPAILSLVAEIAGEVGRLGVIHGASKAPMLRRKNRIRSIHASLAIENNTLTLDQVTAVIAGKRVLGPPSEIQEVKNAFYAYESMDRWNPFSIKDLLSAHRVMLQGLVNEAGKFRNRAVGIAQGKKIVHLAPPAHLIPGQMKNLLAWLKRNDSHPLISSSVFHYELEFIHPFADGNGRIGRLWQTLILSRWHPLFAYLPLETVIREQQEKYYKVLAICDKAGNSTAFIEFLLRILLTALHEIDETDQVADQVTDQVTKLIFILRKHGPLSASDAVKRLNLSHRPTFRANYLRPAITAGLVEPTIPDKPNSRLQKYRLTAEGCSWKDH